MAIEDTPTGDQIADVSLTRDEVFLIAYAIRFAEYRDVLRQLKKDGCLYEQDDFNNLLQKLDASTKKK